MNRRAPGKYLLRVEPLSSIGREEMPYTEYVRRLVIAALNHLIAVTTLIPTSAIYLRTTSTRRIVAPCSRCRFFCRQSRARERARSTRNRPRQKPLSFLAETLHGLTQLASAATVCPPSSATVYWEGSIRIDPRFSDFHQLVLIHSIRCGSVMAMGARQVVVNPLMCLWVIIPLPTSQVTCLRSARTVLH